MKYLILLLTIIILTSCSPVSINLKRLAEPSYYQSSSVNAPLISNKGEKNISVSVAPPGSIDVQASAGISKNISAIFDYNSFSQNQNEVPFTFSGNPSYKIKGESKFKSFETGLGYYTKLSDKVVFEAYGLAGFGNIEHTYSTEGTPSENSSGNLNADFLKTGVQFNFGRKAENYAMVMSLRALNLQFSNIDSDLFYYGENQRDYLIANDNLWIIEPAVTLRGGFKHVQFQMQIGSSINLTNNKFIQNEGFLGVGMNFLFNRE